MEIKITINDKLINVLKKVFTMKNSIFFIAVALFCGGLLIFSQQVDLDTFHNGDIIYAGPINDNFQALRDRELGSLADVDTSGAAEWQVLKYDGTTWAPGTDNTGGLGVWTESGNDIYWNGAGNVGIGTTSPYSTLDIHGTNNTELRITTNFDSVGKSATLAFGNEGHTEKAGGISL